MSTFHARFDAKGRMSVPAAYRAALRAGSADGATSLVLRPSHKHDCIEAWPTASFLALGSRVEQLDAFGDDEDDMTTTLYADAWPVEPDKEGRISVPDSLVQHAGLTDSVTFMGKGGIFEIWEPEAALGRLANARVGVNARRVTLPPART